LALGAQRLLPTLQNSYGAWSSIQGSYRSLIDALDLLEQPMSSYYDCANQIKLDFISKIELCDLSFRYPNQANQVIVNLCLTINKGDRVGIVGATGNGKTTLVDILMGLLEPTSGYMSVDGITINNENVRAWQKNIAHVPQTIFLADKSIAENIAFGVELIDIDWNRLRIAAEKAQLQKVIDALPDGYNSIIGERGVRLSGGQRQRIGIARAMYKNAGLLIFDEATSALDNQTEDLVMRAIDSLAPDITVIMIAHRLTTLKKCTKVIELGNGGVVKLDSYQNMINLYQ
jgi:ATP-binding cassette subfamily B protein